MGSALDEAIKELHRSLSGSIDSVELFVRADGRVYVLRRRGDFSDSAVRGDISEDGQTVSWLPATPAPGKEP